MARSTPKKSEATKPKSPAKPRAIKVKPEKPEAPAPPAEEPKPEVTLVEAMPTPEEGMGQTYHFPGEISVGIQVELEKAGWKYDVGTNLFEKPDDLADFSYLEFLDYLADLAERIGQSPPYTAEFKILVEEAVANPPADASWVSPDNVLATSDAAALTEEDTSDAVSILENLGKPGAYTLDGWLKTRPDGPEWEAAEAMFEYGQRLPSDQECDDFRRTFRLTAEEWKTVRDFYLHPRDTGHAPHRGRPIPVSRFRTRETPDGPVPTGGFSIGLGYDINWQDGVDGANGAIIEDIIEYALIPRLEFFMVSSFASMETGLAIKHLREAIAALDLRTQRRKQTGVYGSYKE